MFSGIGLGLSLVCCLVGLMLFQMARRYRKIAALGLVLSVTGVSGSTLHAQDFDAAARREIPAVTPSSTATTNSSTTDTGTIEDCWSVAASRPAVAGVSGAVVAAFEGIQAKPPAVKSAARPFRALMYSPSWCGVCVTNDRLLSAGDSRCEYRCIKGDPRTGDQAAFPADVQAMGVSGYPVWSIECADGVYRLANRAKCFDDLVGFHKVNGVYARIPPSKYHIALHLSGLTAGR